ncbi:MAG: hypothetical protein HY738_24325 [Bacteroidia bacterium]|nr:hypothetical protein [Bacteroidia bacterium]
MKRNHVEIKEDNSLKILQVFDSLEVGPVKVEKNKLSAPYTLKTNRRSDTNHLIYHYDENVFDPDEPASHNIASMIAAQVAMNYGLFCKKLIFKGIYDSSDKKFIREMTENTSREIYVKKFLEHNPFLLGDAAHLPVVKKKKYSLAEIEFETTQPGSGEHLLPWNTSQNKHCILSSGGKDSLLSFGLINEICEAPHPIFINESGRHWFTALNAYRYFKKQYPNTSRVWTNCDRIYPWFLRRMPFIRKDFNNVRADEYPIRLWTVAVFLFSALPLLRKRGIGRLIIGDEFDTTRKFNFKGITHYDGLFDQSRYFDNYMTQYFTSKGWNITQFSVLRQLSELLIEKILATRYPELLKQQVSCHATHIQGNRVKPCGRCEKCRRIVGMLKVIGVAPANCGYSDEQIKNCLKDLAEKPVNQLSYEAEHLKSLLSEKGLISLPTLQKKSLKKCPEVQKLRFHSQNSPIDTIPVDLQKSLYKILLKYANNCAVEKSGKKWRELIPDDLLH